MRTCPVTRLPISAVGSDEVEIISTLSTLSSRGCPFRQSVQTIGSPSKIIPTESRGCPFRQSVQTVRGGLGRYCPCHAAAHFGSRFRPFSYSSIEMKTVVTRLPISAVGSDFSSQNWSYAMFSHAAAHFGSRFRRSRYSNRLDRWVRLVMSYNVAQSVEK